MISDCKIRVPWYIGCDGRNWGDALNPVLVSKISGMEVEWINASDGSDTFRYFVIGSLLQSLQSKNAEVWGTGFMRSSDKLKVKPKKIHAVRGPLTRESLIRQGYECPKVYGDPALLYSKYFNPNVQKKYKMGIIPHYIESKSTWLDRFENVDDVLIIDILDPIDKVVTDIKSCEKIISSSLHGIIAGDAYGIPSYYLKLSDKVRGDGFKFRDYFMSVGRPDTNPIVIKGDERIMDISKHFHKYEIDLETIQNKLLDSCPFKKSQTKN